MPNRNLPGRMPATAAGQQFTAWPAAFNSGTREALIAYHGRYFPLERANWEGIGVVPDVPAPADDALDVAHRLERLGRHE
jgi:hypothetical protein